MEQVAAFLKAGALPDVEGQRQSPPWAAATSGDVNLAAMLLDLSLRDFGDVLPIGMFANETHLLLQVLWIMDTKVARTAMKKIQAKQPPIREIRPGCPVSCAGLGAGRSQPQNKMKEMGAWAR